MEWLQVLLFNTNYFIQHYSFICMESNGSKHCYVILMIPFRHTVKGFQVLLFNTCNSIQHYSFICSRLNGSKYCCVIQAIQFSISHLFTHCKKSNSFIWPINKTLSGTTTPGQSWPGSNGNEGALHIPQSSRTESSPSDCLMSYPGHSVGRRVLHLCINAAGVFFSHLPSDWGVECVICIWY